MAFATNLFNLLPERVHRRTDKQGNYKYYNYRGMELSEEEVIKAFEANGVRREMVEAWYYLMDKIRKATTTNGVRNIQFCIPIIGLTQQNLEQELLVNG